MAIFFFLFLNLFNFNAFSQELLAHGPSDAQIKAMAEHNLKIAQREPQLGPVGSRSSDVKPFHEWDKTGYLVFSDDDFYGIAKKMKQTVAENLPEDVTLLVYTRSSNEDYHQDLFDYYAQFIPEDRLKIIEVPNTGSSDFWARDNTPVPVWQNGKFALVDAQYYYNFEPDLTFSELFSADLDAHDYFYEGGNFMANSRGDCLMVNRKRYYSGGVSDTAAIPDDIFESKYGCQKIIRFKHLKGIGHADEVVKFMTDDIVLTDTEEYVETLEEAGYQVVLLPEPDYNYETYINSLIVNDTVFVPIFGESNDQKALDIYDDLNLGLKIVPIMSRQLATQGQGGIHCITMNYPPTPLSVLTRQSGWELRLQ